MASREAQEVKERLTDRSPRNPSIHPDDLLSFGLTRLNLAVAGRTTGGIPKGKYIYFVGDSSSGKTWFVHQILAEAARNSFFDKYRFIYDASENGALMDVEYYFGRKLADRIVPPKGTVEEPKYSSTVQEMYYNIDDALDEGPCIFVEDSMDALLAEEDEEKFQEQKTAFEKGKETTGSYGVAKARVNSSNINRVVKRLEETGSILILISQTRDKIGGVGYQTKTRSGGKALRFYAHVELWTSLKGPIKKTVMGKEREIGNLIQIDVQKNRLTGWEGKIEVPFYRSFGLDEVGSCIDFLVEEKHWKKADKGGKIIAADFEFEGSREDLIKTIEQNGDERELQLLVGAVWKKIEDASAVLRKPRYD